LAYQKTISELERLTRLVKAYEWTLAVEKAKKTADDVKERHAMEEERKRELGKFGTELKGMGADIKEIQKKRDMVRLRLYALMDVDIELMPLTFSGTCERRESPSASGQSERVRSRDHQT
jgi:hypothetical protein